MTKLKRHIETIGNLSAQKKVIERLIKSEQKELMDEIRMHGDQFLESYRCDKCEGTGKDLDGPCISCDGEGERWRFVVPTDDTDIFSCSVYEVTQRYANQTEAREILTKETFQKIFKPVGYKKIDINITAYGKLQVEGEAA